jgi:hypothetical protein
LNEPTLLHQPAWVLQSASADQPNLTKPSRGAMEEARQSWRLIQPGLAALQRGDSERAQRLWATAMQEQPSNLLLQRAVNRHRPQLLRQNLPSRRGAPWGSRIAIVLPGELRCLKHSQHFLASLSRHADLFICTSPGYAQAAATMPGMLKVVDPEPNLPMGSMQQWHKLALALALVRQQETTSGRRYTHILKLRTDFHHAQPRHLLQELVNADGLICASDKVFGGRRELMLLFEGFFPAIAGWFDQQEQRYWPIHVTQILRSDDSAKWYGMAFPRELVGEPESVEKLRVVMERGGASLAEALMHWKPPAASDPNTLYWRLFQGHPRFASEVCFARFLNFNAIPAHSCPGLLGFLRSDRLQR